MLSPFLAEENPTLITQGSSLCELGFRIFFGDMDITEQVTGAWNYYIMENFLILNLQIKNLRQVAANLWRYACLFVQV